MMRKIFCRKFGRVIGLSFVLALVFCFAANAQTKKTQEPAKIEKTKLAAPTFLYISDKKLFWGGQAPGVGIYVVFSGPEERVIKTGKDPVDLYRYMKDGTAPAFRVRCIPEFHEKDKYDPSDWLDPHEVTLEQLSGLGLNGWIYVPDRWYYFVDGEPQRGWLTLDGKDYYLDPETGIMQEGWLYDNRKWYYFEEESGNLLEGTVTPDGYTVDKDGVWGGR